MSENGEEPRIVIDYNAIDEATGFKKAELTIWQAFEKNVLQVPEDDRPDPEGWAEEWAEENQYDRKRVKAVTILGIYAGRRDEFSQRSGAGKAHYANGDVYEGDFLEGKKHGQGHYTFVKQGKGETDKHIEKALAARAKSEEVISDELFIIETAKALKIGRVIVDSALEYGLLPCYHGDYIRGMRVGQGLMKAKDGSVYKGDWLNNKRHGQGMFYYVNGDVYSGEWSEGLKHGFGTYRFANGGEYRGEWVKGNFVDGQWIMADGIYYEGKFDKKNRPCDTDGVVHFPHLNVSQTGLYKMDRWFPKNEMAIDHEMPVNEKAWIV